MVRYNGNIVRIGGMYGYAIRNNVVDKDTVEEVVYDFLKNF